MVKICVLLLLAVITLPGDVRGDDAAPSGPFGCADPEALYAILNVADAKQRGKLIARKCLSLVGAHYVLIGEGGGLARIRVFVTPGDWATSLLVYTLDEMLD